MGVEGVTHDDKRHDTQCANRRGAGHVQAHRHQECLSFLCEIDKAVPAELDVHCIVDNLAIHNHPKVKAWLVIRPAGTCNLGISYQDCNIFEAFLKLPVPQRRLIREVILTFAKVHAQPELK